MARPKGVIVANTETKDGGYWEERCFIQVSEVSYYYETYGGNKVVVMLSCGTQFTLKMSLAEFEDKWNAAVV